MVSRKCPQKLVKSPVHQQDKHAGAGGCEGRVKGLGDLYGKTWDCKSSEELSYKGEVPEEYHGLLEGGVITVAGGSDDGFVEGGVSQDVD